MRTNLRMSGKNRIFAGGKNRTRSIRRSQSVGAISAARRFVAAYLSLHSDRKSLFQVLHPFYWVAVLFVCVSCTKHNPQQELFRQYLDKFPKNKKYSITLSGEIDLQNE